MAAVPARRPPQDVEATKPDLFLGRMSLLHHLEELRKCLFRSALAVGVGMCVAFFFIEQIFNFVFAPTRRMLPPGTSLIYTQPGEAFGLYINIALVTGAIVASPVIFLNVWRFVAPALYSRERRFVIPFVALTTIGAVGGAAFSHYVLFPYMIGFFGTFSSPDLQFMPQVSDVFGLYLKMLGGTVLMFQMPTFAFFMARMRMLTAGWLWRNVKYAVLVIFIVAAVITPSPDPWTQTLFAAPMIVLYAISILVAWLAAPRRQATDREGR